MRQNFAHQMPQTLSSGSQTDDGMEAFIQQMNMNSSSSSTAGGYDSVDSGMQSQKMANQIPITMSNENDEEAAEAASSSSAGASSSSAEASAAGLEMDDNEPGHAVNTPQDLEFVNKKVNGRPLWNTGITYKTQRQSYNIGLNNIGGIYLKPVAVGVWYNLSAAVKGVHVQAVEALVKMQNLKYPKQ
jgi:hypothetical protein